MELLYVLLILLVATRAFGEIAERLGQPALVGELLAGIVLGVAAGSSTATLPVLSQVVDDPVFAGITDLAIFFLMLLAGLEMRPRELAKASGGAVGVALGGLLLPLSLGVLLGWVALPDSPLRQPQMLFLGVALAITAVPVSVKVLMDLGMLESRIGRLVVSAALFDDVFSLVLLAVLTSVIQTGSPPGWIGIAALVGKVALFFGVTLALGRTVVPALGRRIRRHFALDELELSFLLVVALGYAVLAEVLEMHFIIGAFVAGLLFVRGTIDDETYRDVHRKVSGITKGFLAPLFFASIGLHLRGDAVVQAPLFVLALVGAAAIGKILGAALPARALGLSSRESAAVGIGMNARGAVELVIADIALRAHLFEPSDEPSVIVESLYSAVVVVAVVTTLATPVALRRVLRPSGA